MQDIKRSNKAGHSSGKSPHKSRTNNTPTTVTNTPEGEPNTEKHRLGEHPERLHGPKSGEEERSGTKTDQ